MRIDENRSILTVVLFDRLELRSLCSRIARYQSVWSKRIRNPDVMSAVVCGLCFESEAVKFGFAVESQGRVLIKEKKLDKFLVVKWMATVVLLKFEGKPG